MGPRILVCGGHNDLQQFVRNVEALQCKVDWVNGDPSDRFPKFCDAAVIAKFQLSHAKFWAVKEAYTKQGKQVFIADHSWSTIKERFEKFVTEYKQINPQQTTILGAAMQKAIAKETPTQEWEPRKTNIERMRIQYPPGVRDKIFKAVSEHFRAGMSCSESAAQLNRIGLTLADGRPIAASNVSVWRGSLRLLKRETKPKSAEAEVKPPPVPKAVKAKGPDKVVYELILHANLPAQETTALMRRCMDGKLSQDEALKFIELYTDLKEG